MRTVLSTLLSLLLLATLSATAVHAMDEAATACHDVQCPPADATAQSFCAAEAGVCSETPQIPEGFQLVDGSEITIDTASGAQHVPLSKAVRGLGHGGLCCGVVAQVTGEDVTLYRAWAPRYDDRYTAPPLYAASYQFGNWWSAEQPDRESHKNYRTDNDICLTWDALTVYSACTIAKGTQVFIGPGQSACCAGAGCSVTSPQACPGSCPNACYLQQSEMLQIWVPSYVDPDTGKSDSGTQDWFHDCTTYTWPSAPNS